MTIAVDRATGEVIGQVVFGEQDSEWVELLTRDGYRIVSRASVRLEVVR